MQTCTLVEIMQSSSQAHVFFWMLLPVMQLLLFLKFQGGASQNVALSHLHRTHGKMQFMDALIGAQPMKHHRAPASMSMVSHFDTVKKLMDDPGCGRMLLFWLTLVWHFGSRVNIELPQ